MPSAYTLAKDQIQQARAMLANEVWFDTELDHMFEIALMRLEELDFALDEYQEPARDAAIPMAPRAPRVRMMPWLDP